VPVVYPFRLLLEFTEGRRTLCCPTWVGARGIFASFFRRAVDTGLGACSAFRLVPKELAQEGFPNFPRTPIWSVPLRGVLFREFAKILGE